MSKKQISNQVSTLDGCVIEHDYVYIATQLDELDMNIYAHTRMSTFDYQNIGTAKSRNGWGYHDLNLHIISVGVKTANAIEGRRLCALSREGQVEIYSGKLNKGIIEKIPDAGISTSEFKGGITGYVTHIREVGANLYVCGLNGQIYKRPPEGGWIHIDAGLFQPLTDESSEPTNLFTCIDGNAENDIYVVGMQGVIFHYDGWEWRPIASPADEHLQWVRCYGRDEVYICGHNGTLLKGSARNGFVNVSAIEDNDTWWCVCKFEDKVYLSSTSGLYAWDGQTIAKVVSGLQPEIETWRVDTDGKALWSFGSKDLTWFDGKQWTRLHDPDNPKIGE